MTAPPKMTAEELDALERLINTVTPLTWANRVGRVWDALPSLIASARREARLHDALEWVLPMAKGYAAEHPDGSNQALVVCAEGILRNGITEELAE